MDCKSCGTGQPAGAKFCSSCGVDLNGSGGGPPKKKMSGCTLAALIVGGLLVVSVPIVGIIAAIAVPNFLNAVDRGKQKRTLADMRSISAAIEGYAIDHDVYPTANDIVELESLLAGDYIKVMPTTDGWTHPIQVVSESGGYLLVSPGKDGVVDGCGGGAQSSFDADICLENGMLTQWPEGVQH